MPALAGILSKLKPTVNREKDGREQFPNRVAFILAAIGGAVGLGNVLRYPSVVFANSGLQWFIPYLIALLFLGIPVLLLEISLGQAYRAGVVTSFNSLHNRTKGVGLGVVLTGYMVVCYYVPILAWIMHYFRGSFQSPLPWGDDPDAYFMGQVIANTDPLEGTIEGGRVTQYTDYPGMGMVGETAGWCAFIWVCVWLSLFSGISLTGRAVYFTMGFPIVMIFVLLGRSASLERAGEGVKYYFGEWHSDKLAGGQIWQGACGQIFFSIGVGFGYFTTYASYNPRFANAVQDTLIIACSNSMFEIVAGFVVFSIIGFLEMTPEKDGQDLSTFVVGFLTYPAALSEMPGANFFAVIWFLTIACLGVSSSVALTETMVTMIHESSVGSRHPRWMIATGVIVVSFLLSLMYCSKFGFYLLDAVDTWVNNLTLLMIVLCEIVSVATMYRWSDVVSQVGMVAYLTSCISYIFSLIIGVAVGQAVSPEAGAGVGFGIFGIGQVASVLLSKTPDSIAPAFFGKNGFIAKFWWLNFYTFEQLRRDLNVIIGYGKNWNIPFFWGPILRFISAPILAIILSFAYPDFLEKRMDPLHIFGFAASHISVVLALTGLIIPRALDVFVQPSRRGDWKVHYGPQILNPIFVARAEGTDITDENDNTATEREHNSSDNKRTEKGLVPSTH